METSERRLEILKYLSQAREATMPQLAKMFDVSIRTIQRDILMLETTFHVPLDIRCGKYDGGVHVIGDYSFDRAYMCEEELLVLRKVQALIQGQLSEKENTILSKIIKNYTKSA